MIAFGCAIASERKYRRYARPGIERAGDRSSVVIEIRGRDCLFRAYNEAISRAASIADLEALVLLHEDVEIIGDRFGERLRRTLGDPDVAVVGALGSGASGIGGIDWWSFEPGLGRLLWEVPDPAEAWGTSWMMLFGWEEHVPFGTAGSLDGALIALSPWAVRNLRFDEALGPAIHAYDADICLEARRRGKKVVVANLPIVHHTDMTWMRRSGERWKRAHAAFARKWGAGPRVPIPAGRGVEGQVEARRIARERLEARGLLELSARESGARE